jgi:ribosomal protein S1
MVEIGAMIRATVTRVEPYGVYLAHGPETVLVLLPEVSWSDSRPLAERIRPGEEYDVLVLRYNYRDRQIVGSIRRLHRSQNPYRQLARLEPGTVLRVRVVLLAGDEYTVELPNGAWGHVPRRQVPAPVKQGDPLDVVISAVEVDEGRLSLEPTRTDAHQPTGPVAPLPTEVNA